MRPQHRRQRDTVDPLLDQAQSPICGHVGGEVAGDPWVSGQSREPQRLIEEGCIGARAVLLHRTSRVSSAVRVLLIAKPG